MNGAAIKMLPANNTMTGKVGKYKRNPIQGRLLMASRLETKSPRLARRPPMAQLAARLIVIGMYQ